MARLSLDYLLNKEIDEIIEVVKKKDINPWDMAKVRDRLKGYFTGKKDLIQRDYSITIDGVEVYIWKISKSSGRVFFRFRHSPEKMSISIADLTDAPEDDFPYKKGDKCVFENDIWDVTQIIPSSKRLIIKCDSKVKNISINKVTKFYDD